MKSFYWLVFIGLLVLPSSALSAGTGLTVKAVRHFSYTDFTRIVFEIEAAGPYVLTRTADGLLLSAYEGAFTLKCPLPMIRDGVVNGIETREDASKLFVVIRLDSGAADVKDFVLRGPDRIVVDVAKRAAPAPPAAPSDKPTLIVLDPGHGGKDAGIVTGQGQEKSITLDLALAVKKILHTDPRLKVVLTRDRDIALTLDERAAAANSGSARVFVSIHASAGNTEQVYIQDPDQDPGVQAERLVTKDFLSFETGSEQRENIWSRQQAAHAGESITLGRTLARQFGRKERAEPVQAPVTELKAVDAAAVMIEVGTEVNRIKTAEAVAKGIAQYVRENR